MRQAIGLGSQICRVGRSQSHFHERDNGLVDGVKPSGRFANRHRNGLQTAEKKQLPTGFWVVGGPLAAFCARAVGPHFNWVGLVEEADWRTFADVRSTFSDADLVGDLTVFNIGRNKYRIVAYVSFKTDTSAWVFIKFVGTHKEYDRLDLNA